MKRNILRAKTSFQDSPGDGYYFVLYYNEKPLAEQIDELGLVDGDVVILWEPDCGDLEVPAVLLFDFKHPMAIKAALWAKEISTETLPKTPIV